jgi:hypothetical protein
MKSIESHNESPSDPRIFFGQLAEASGVFPLEINVPETFVSMMNGVSTMYDTVSSYFGSGGESEVQGQEESATQIEESSKMEMMLMGKKKKKKIDSVKNIEESDYDYLFDFVLF